MGNSSSCSRSLNSHWNKSVLEFKKINNDIRKIINELDVQKDNGKKYSIFDAEFETEVLHKDIIIFVYPANREQPRIERYFNSIRSYRFLELPNLITKFKQRRPYRKAITKDGMKVYWIRYRIRRL